MLTNEWAIIFNLLSIVVTALLVTTVLLCFAWLAIAQYIEQFSLHTQKRILWLFVSAPWLLSIIYVAFFVPSLFQSHNTIWLTHWHHPHEFYLTSWHGAFLFVSALGFIYVLTRKLITASRHLSALSSLTGLFQNKGQHEQISLDVVVLESQTPLAFSAGIFNPKCYVTTGLVEQFSGEELDIILEHERAHIKHKDLQQKLLFTLLVSFFPKPVSFQLNRSFSLVAEKLADQSVCENHSKLDIAQTLIKSVRAQKLSKDYFCSAVVNYFTSDDVDSRVKALIEPQDYRLFSWNLCLIFLASFTIVSFVGVDGLHHLIETLFSH